MLFRRSVLDAIGRGEVDLAFRSWDRPYAKPGGRQRTAVGVVEFVAVELVVSDELVEADALRAGYTSLSELWADAAGRPGNGLYRVELRLVGDDPRAVLRDQADLADDEVAELVAVLAGLDARSRHEPWTWQVLALVQANPGVRAGDLADRIGRERLPFKADVRKLKELGLTESLEVGYRLSPRGAELLHRRPSPS